MPTRLGEPYSPAWRGNYPHMLKEDMPVWNRFLDTFGFQFKWFYYDVEVGGTHVEDKQYGIDWGKMFHRLTAKRIDAIAEKEEEIWIIEVSVNPSLRAVGQLITYMTLWAADPKILKPASGWLVCERLDPDLQLALRVEGLNYIVI